LFLSYLNLFLYFVVHSTDANILSKLNANFSKNEFSGTKSVGQSIFVPEKTKPEKGKGATSCHSVLSQV